MNYTVLGYTLCVIFSARIIIACPISLGRFKNALLVSFFRAVFEIVFLLPFVNRHTALLIIVLIAGTNLLESLFLRLAEKRNRGADANATKFLFSILSAILVFLISSLNLNFEPAQWAKVFYRSMSAWFLFLESIEPVSLGRVLLSFSGFLFSVFLINDGILLLLNKYQIIGSTEASASESVSTKNIQRGKVIGVLERAVLYLLMLTGDYSAIGFVLAAKTLVRFKELEDSKDFAEYFLIGTLASLGGTILIRFLLLFFMNGV